MLKLLSRIHEDLRTKARWCYESETPQALLKVCFTDGTAAMLLYRLMQASGEAGLGPLEMVFNKLNGVVGSCVIGRGADFGDGLCIIHSNGIVINGNVKIGKRLHIEHQVTIGAEKRHSPEIGDDVYIGAGAKIIGPVKIGDGARIGANAVVVHDVPAHTTVVGIPAKPVQRRDKGDGQHAANGNGHKG